MKRIAAAVGTLILAGCGPSGHQPAQEAQLQLVVSDTPITLQAGQTLALQLLVIGAGSEQATISSPDLPPFAVLQGSLLTLSPSRQYEGDYTLTLVATTQSSNASASLHVTVQRPETAPRLWFFSISGTSGDNLGGSTALDRCGRWTSSIAWTTGAGPSSGASITPWPTG